MLWSLTKITAWYVCRYHPVKLTFQTWPDRDELHPPLSVSGPVCIG